MACPGSSQCTSFASNLGSLSKALWSPQHQSFPQGGPVRSLHERMNQLRSLKCHAKKTAQESHELQNRTFERIIHQNKHQKKQKQTPNTVLHPHPPAHLRRGPWQVRRRPPGHRQRPVEVAGTVLAGRSTRTGPVVRTAVVSFKVRSK